MLGATFHSPLFAAAPASRSALDGAAGPRAGATVFTRAWPRVASGGRPREERALAATRAGPPEGPLTRELLARARAGELDAFAEIFAEHREAILRVCRRLLDDTTSADDAGQEVFLRAQRSLERYDASRPFGPWIRRLASNYCIDQLRRRKTERALFSSADLDETDLADDAPDALQRVAHRQEQQDVLAALDRLPAKYRVPLVLRFYEERDYDAIAEILGVTRNQVGTLLFRAKKRLRAELAGRSLR